MQVMKNLIYNTLPDPLCADVHIGVLALLEDEHLRLLCTANTFTDRADSFIAHRVDHVIWDVIVNLSEKDLDSISGDWLNAFTKVEARDKESIFMKLAKEVYDGFQTVAS